jgi:type IV pilus assembly protein PilC
MPIYQYEAMDSTGQEVKDIVDAPSEAEAQATIRQMGYFVTKIAVKKARKTTEKKAPGAKKKRQFALGGVSSKVRVVFTRNLSILQDAGLPILRSLRILEQQSKPGKFKNCLMDVCDEIEGGATLSEAMSKSPKAFDRLYVNMIKAGEAGGALEVILRRLAEFQERAQSLKRKVKGAMVYPVVVIMVAVGILTFIMIKIVPAFEKIFKDFKSDLPTITRILINVSHAAYDYWWAIPLIPVSFWLFIKLLRKFPYGREGWDLFTLKVPIFGQLVEKNTLARTTRTLGTLISSGVPILEALNITKETSGNSMFEKMYGKVSDAIREGESIAKPLKEYSRASFNAIALLFWTIFIPVFGALMYVLRMNQRIVDDLVVNMVDVGEETGELDTMLYKVADTYDEEVAVLTESLTKLMEPLLIICLGGAVGFIVVALFMPLVALITNLTGGSGGAPKS